MRHPLSSRWPRLLLGAAALIAGAALLIARPSTVLAHHAEASFSGDCAGWTFKAEYIGGGHDRFVVVDLTVNSAPVYLEFYFDNGPGHLGHQDYWLLYETSGSGSVAITGTITLYYKYKRLGKYTRVDNSISILESLMCATATPTHTPTRTSTPVPTYTPIPTSTHTPTSTSTTVAQGTITPLPTSTGTPAASTPTPAATSTSTPASTPTSTGGTVTPVATGTPGGSTSTPVPTTTSTPVPTATNTPATGASATPTFVSTVEGAVPPEQGGPDTPPEGPAGLPSTGDGFASGRTLLIGIVGLFLLAAGLTTVATGVGRRRAS